ncbi:hypothetical protein CPLU01_15546 [Colletotrichum plurivorum]|uniref:Uncharacterized protein n=1 Tax=Colletotrichum plurivorum TaxID=2175906 RepID=A0A8H6JAV0_9PEZI|nr:hypothetical protein CPLU01_15546 [Colletotrichum plurivorum]
MRPVFILSALLPSLAVAAPAELHQRQDSITHFDASEFKANCRADNTGCSWSITIISRGLATIPVVPVTCSALTAVGKKFPSSSPPLVCSDPIAGIDFTRVAQGYRLSIFDAQSAEKDEVAATVLPIGDWLEILDSTGYHETYIGPSEFTVPVV